MAMFDNSKPHAVREKERKSQRFSEQHESKVPSAARAARNARGRLSPVEVGRGTGGGLWSGTHVWNHLIAEIPCPAHSKL